MFFPGALGCLNSLQKRSIITKSCPSQWCSAHRSLYRKTHILGSILMSQPLPAQSRRTCRRTRCNSKLLHIPSPSHTSLGLLKGLIAVPPAKIGRCVLHSTENVGNVTTYIRPHKPSSFLTCQALPVHLYKGWWLIYTFRLLSSF